MNIIIITQDEPFYLVDNLEYLINNLPAHSKVVGCVVNDVSPFGKKETFLQKAKKTYDIFGLDFFLHYSFKFIKSKLTRSKNIHMFLSKNNIDSIILDKPINNQSSVDIIKDMVDD